MVLLAADGMPNAEIARVTGVSRPAVISWRQRYQRGGIKALGMSRAAAGRRRSSEAGVVVAAWLLAGSLRPGLGSRTGRPVPGRGIGL
jgi:transposase